MQFNEKTTGTCLHKAIKICLIKAVYSVTTINTLTWIIFIIILHLHQGYKYINTCAFCSQSLSAFSLKLLMLLKALLQIALKEMYVIFNMPIYNACNTRLTKIIEPIRQPIIWTCDIVRLCNTLFLMFNILGTWFISNKWNLNFSMLLVLSAKKGKFNNCLVFTVKTKKKKSKNDPSKL